jgi:hypothetical protein
MKLLADPKAVDSMPMMVERQQSEWTGQSKKPDLMIAFSAIIL